MRELADEQQNTILPGSARASRSHVINLSMRNPNAADTREGHSRQVSDYLHKWAHRKRLDAEES